MFHRFMRFIRNVLRSAVNQVVNFFLGAMAHWETTMILIMATLGANMLLSEMPFYVALPMWVEATMVIPVLAVFGVGALLKSAEVRARRSSAHTYMVMT